MVKNISKSKLVTICFLIAVLILSPLFLGGESWLFYYPMLLGCFLISLIKSNKLYEVFRSLYSVERITIYSLFIILFLSSCLTVTPYLSLKFFFFFLANFCILLMAKYAVTSRFRKVIIITIIASVMMQLPILLLQILNILPSNHWNPAMFVGGTFCNHNHLAALLEITLPLSVIFFINLKHKQNDKRLSTLLIISIIMQTGMFVWAQSRGAWLALGISFTIFLYKFISMKRYLIVVTILLLVIFAGLKTDTSMQALKKMRSLNLKEQDYSSQSRLTIWQATTTIIKHNLILGTGPGTFAQVFPYYRPLGLGNYFINQPHNDYLCWMAEVGVLSISLILVLITSIIVRGVKSSIKTHPFSIAAGISTLSIAMHSLVDYPLRIPAIALYLAVLIGMSLNEKNQKTMKVGKKNKV